MLVLLLSYSSIVNRLINKKKNKDPRLASPRLFSPFRLIFLFSELNISLASLSFRFQNRKIDSKMRQIHKVIRFNVEEKEIGNIIVSHVRGSICALFCTFYSCLPRHSGNFLGPYSYATNLTLGICSRSTYVCCVSLC